MEVLGWIMAAGLIAWMLAVLFVFSAVTVIVVRLVLFLPIEIIRAVQNRKVPSDPIPWLSYRA